MNTHQKKYEVLEKAEIWDNLGKTSRSCNSSWAKLRAKTPDNKTFNPVNEPDISATHKRQTIGSGVCTFGCRKFKNTTIHRKALLKIWTYSAATCNAVSRAFLPFQESFKRVRACNHVSYRPWQLVMETNKKKLKLTDLKAFQETRFENKCGIRWRHPPFNFPPPTANARPESAVFWAYTLQSAEDIGTRHRFFNYLPPPMTCCFWTWNKHRDN